MFSKHTFSTGPEVGDREGSPGRVRAMKLQMMTDKIKSQVESAAIRGKPKPKPRPTPQGPTKPGKKDKKEKKSKHAKEKEVKDGKGKKEKKDKRKKHKKAKGGDSSDSSEKSTSSAWFYRGKPCTVTAISYETDPPHAVVRTADGREVVVEMNALVHKSKKRRTTTDKTKPPSMPITIECSSSASASGDSDSGVEVIGELPGPGTAAVGARELTGAGAAASDAAASEQERAP